MKAYILDTQRRIPPFDKSVSKIYSPFINFGNLVREEIALAKVKVRGIKDPKEIDNSEPVILLPDYVFVTASLIKKFIFLCQNTPNKIQRLSVIKSKLTDFYAPLMDLSELSVNGERRLLFDIFYIPKGVPYLKDCTSENIIERLRKEAIDTKVSQNFGIRVERAVNVKNRPFFEEFPVTDEIVGHLTFWIHPLLMNILYLNTYRNRLMASEYSFGFLNKKEVIDEGNIRGSVVGSNVWLHPTSIIENSVIADNTRVGARAIIKNSVIMRDCNIGDCNIIKNSLFGESVTSLSNSRFRSSVIAPNCTVSNLGFCYSMLGEGSFLTTAVIFLYEGVDSTIKIRCGKEEYDTGKYFLGSAAGENSILGTRAIVSPGLSIPSKTLIVLRPEEGVMKIQDLIESEYYIWDSATLKRFEDVFPHLNKTDFL
ncbi:MAG: hypothetical protein N2746_00195 [Deltaproteobacteria bacterium]|nr:hypothetical protein [Deltaproteobacteria bacterium]